MDFLALTGQQLVRPGCLNSLAFGSRQWYSSRPRVSETLSLRGFTDLWNSSRNHSRLCCFCLPVLRSARITMMWLENGCLDKLWTPHMQMKACCICTYSTPDMLTKVHVCTDLSIAGLVSIITVPILGFQGKCKVRGPRWKQL